MPMEVGKLIAENFIVDLDRVKRLHKDVRHRTHFFNHSAAVVCRQVKEFRDMAFEDQHRPSGEELVFEQVRDRCAAVRNHVVGRRPLACACLARGLHGVAPAFSVRREESLVNQPSSRSTASDDTLGGG